MLSEISEIDHEKSVLLVEDDQSTANLLGLELVEAGVLPGQQRVADTLAKARDAIRLRRPDLVLLDLQLPDGSGIALGDESEAGEYGDPLNIVAISVDSEARQAALRHGIRDFVPKPFDFKEIKSLARRFLTRARVYGGNETE